MCVNTQTPQWQEFSLPAEMESDMWSVCSHHMSYLLALLSSFPDMLDSMSGLSVDICMVLSRL